MGNYNVRVVVFKDSSKVVSTVYNVTYGVESYDKIVEKTTGKLFNLLHIFTSKSDVSDDVYARLKVNLN
jgi:hypothetical protein